MTVVICSNEHDLLWVFDPRLPQRWSVLPGTPIGTYYSIAAAFVGDPLEVVYLQETESQVIVLADPKWVGILSYLGIEVSQDYCHGQNWILSHYVDFISPYAEQIKLTALDFVQEYKPTDFNQKVFEVKAWIKYSLKPCQVKTAILYAKRIYKGCKSDEEFAAKLDAVFEKVKTIERLHLSSSATERVDYQTNSIVTSVVNDLIPNQMTDQELQKERGFVKWLAEPV